MQKLLPIEYFCNFWISLDLLLINSEIEPDLLWSKDFIISKTLNNTEVPADPNANPPIQNLPEGFTTGAIFQINSAKHYVLAVTLSVKDNFKFLENIKQGFKRIYIDLSKFIIYVDLK